jgi:hypothetical protein
MDPTATTPAPSQAAATAPSVAELAAVLVGTPLAIVGVLAMLRLL